MPKTGTSSRASRILVSQLVADASVMALGRGCRCEVRKMAMQDGVELVRWAGNFAQPVELPLCDDSERISFSFNCSLEGQASCLFEDGAHHQIENRAGSIGYGPQRRGTYRQQGALENLSVMVRPDVLQAWMDTPDSDLRKLLAHGGFASWYRGGELLATAQWLNRVLSDSDDRSRPSRQSLWFQGQAISLVALFLEARGTQTDSRPARYSDQRLLRARDRLLADLSQAPSLADLARLAGMSEPSLTRGFRRLFGSSPYGLFQRERMQAARLRLMQDREPISAVAADLGYTNMSHFASAFRQQFQVLPSELKRSVHVTPESSPGPATGA